MSLKTSCPHCHTRQTVDDALARIEACRVLAAIGTPRSLGPLDQAALNYHQDTAFVQQAQLASQQVMARKSHAAAARPRLLRAI